MGWRWGGTGGSTNAPLYVLLAAIVALNAGCSSHPRSRMTSSHAGLAGPASATAGALSSRVLASPPAPTPDTEPTRAAEAAEIVTAMLDLVSLPPGSVQVPTAPAPELNLADNSNVGRRVASAVRFFTVPGDIDGVLGFARAHLPAGFSADGAGQDAGPGTYSAYVVLSGAQSAAFGPPQLTVSAAMAGELIGVRIDAELSWLPAPAG